MVGKVIRFLSNNSYQKCLKCLLVIFQFIYRFLIMIFIYI